MPKVESIHQHRREDIELFREKFEALAFEYLEQGHCPNCIASALMNLGLELALRENGRLRVIKKLSYVIHNLTLLEVEPEDE